MVPRFTEFYIPVLQVMSDVEPIEINNLIDRVADHVDLSVEDRKVMTESGTQFRYRSNISWAVTDLSQGNFIERVKRGTYVITMAGLEMLEENLESIDRTCLAARSESFRVFLEKRGTRKGKSSEEDQADDMQELSVVVEDSKNESAEVSLEELQKIRETLKKAKIPTVDIDQKIKELEEESFFNALLPEISRLLPLALKKYSEKLSFSVEYVPNKEISVLFGDTRRSVTLSENSEHPKKEKKTLKESVRGTSKESKFTNRTSNVSEEVKSIEVPLRKSKPVILESKETKSKGVWIEPYKDRMIVVKGDTDPFNDLFASYGGRIINNPTEGWKGWIFMSNREEGLRKDLSGVLVDPSKKDNPNNDYANKLTNLTSVEYSPLEKKYIDSFSTLRRFNFLGITGPHKAILLIAIFKGIRNGIFQDNRIKFTYELEALYNENWDLYVGGLPSLGAVYPFVHLGREPFFMHKIIRPFKDYDKTWSRHSLERHISYAILDSKLTDLVKNQATSEKFINFLVLHYCSIPSIQETVTVPVKKQTDSTDIRKQQTVMSHKESFVSYVSGADSKHGKSYSKKSINVYVRALNSIQMSEIVSEFHWSKDVFNIQDLEVLSEIKKKVDLSSKKNNTMLLAKSALSLYIKYIKGISI